MATTETRIEKRCKGSKLKLNPVTTGTLEPGRMQGLPKTGLLKCSNVPGCLGQDKLQHSTKPQRSSRSLAHCSADLNYGRGCSNALLTQMQVSPTVTMQKLLVKEHRVSK